MIRDALKFLTEMARDADVPRIEKIGETNYSLRTLHEVHAAEHYVDAIHLSTIRGFVDYLVANPDGLSRDEYLVHVVSETEVRLVSIGLGRKKVRNVAATAEAPVLANPFFEGMSAEYGISLDRALVALPALFYETEDRDDLLRILASVKVDAGVEYTDDGLSQKVVAKKGVRTLENATFSRVRRLAPRRSFPAVGAIESDFVVRLSASGESAKLSIVEADGGAWKLEAIETIANLVENGDHDFRVLR